MGTTKKIAFFDTKPYDRKSFDVTNNDYGFEITYFDTHLNEKTAELTSGFDAVCAFVNDTLNGPVLERLMDHGIQVIGLRCAGYNNVDYRTLNNRIPVLRVPAYSPYAVSEHAAALILSLNRKIHKAYYRTHDGNFSINGLMGFDMHGKTAGIIGAGQIGKCLISILKGFGLNILVYDIFQDQEYARQMNISYVSFEELIEQSDIISLHCPLSKETEHMINKETIDKMINGVMIINTGRGKLIDTQALINGLKCGKIGAAGLDVYEEESEYFFEDKSTDMITDDVLARLLTFPNVLVTSHQGFFTNEAMQNIAETTLSNFEDYFEGGNLKNEICYKMTAT